MLTENRCGRLYLSNVYVFFSNLSPIIPSSIIFLKRYLYNGIPKHNNPTLDQNELQIAILNLQFWNILEKQYIHEALFNNSYQEQPSRAVLQNKEILRFTKNLETYLWQNFMNFIFLVSVTLHTEELYFYLK